ncbi:MAG: hypothetical protein R6U19_06540, partial [Bacteroidales bacterium]
FIIILAGLILPFIISPPDSFTAKSTQSRYNKEALTDFLTKNNLNNNRLIVCFYGASCRFCQLAAKKLDVMIKKAETKSHMHIAFMGSSQKISSFVNDNVGIKDVSISKVEPGEFLRITHGKMPVILLLDNNNVIGGFGYRDLPEDKILQFLD